MEMTSLTNLPFLRSRLQGKVFQLLLKLISGMFSFWTLTSAPAYLNSTMLSFRLWWISVKPWVGCKVNGFTFESGSLELVKTLANRRVLENPLNPFLHYFARVLLSYPRNTVVYLLKKSAKIKVKFIIHSRL